MTAQAPVVAVVPVRDGVSGKSRLAAALDPGARRRLVVALARHVLGVLDGCAAVDRVVVVTADPGFVAEVLDPSGHGTGGPGPDKRSVPPARVGGTDVIREPAGRPGLNVALEHARTAVRAVGPGRLLVVHADLPLLTGDDVAAVLAGPGDVVVATDRHGTGTNLLAVPLGSSGDAARPFGFRFGAGSRAAHEQEAAASGLTCAVVDRPGTALDLDTLADWDDLPTGARRWLRDVVGPGPA
ncbi:2-phospho-L-lactate guanylyltransferase [Isoptericola jiangsuensis]|uniref:Phosphoenolpyruvate guanylyltransferase n=1 Tax=Isoptericola jiangsuensis TaxID=548579 RepID=A0A2A9F0X5_9MICO|nr:2-phospho-L-lactate guanylyltransferase [Isoptericola jiangsuensis]PFG44421.1 2-phospho-L-lactate guanylyltransferase [Isoptericola jiangsuensis]